MEERETTPNHAEIGMVPMCGFFDTKNLTSYLPRLIGEMKVDHGAGNALARIYDDLYGNDVANWLSSDGGADGDGIPNDWELAHGLNPLFDDASGQFDADPYDNWFEYVTDTHPLDGNSWQTFSLEIDPGTGDPTARFSTSASRFYAVEFRDDLTSGSWDDLGSVSPGTGSEMTVPDPAAGNQRFYRLRVELTY